MLPPIKLPNGRIICCAHAQVWPPHWAKLGMTPEDVRAHLPMEEDYERAKTWARVCGLMVMDASKCYSCPLARNEDGTPYVPKPKYPFRNRVVRGAR